MRMSQLDSFKAYDIRGRIPDQVNETLAYDVGRAFAAFIKPRQVCVGYDIRNIQHAGPSLGAGLVFSW